MGAAGERWYHKAWFALLVAIAALELATLVRGRSNETMSSYVRAKIQHPVMRIATGGLLGWLMFHWVGAETTGLGWKDAASTIGGMVVGYFAARQQKLG